MPERPRLSASKGWPQFLFFHAAIGSFIGLLVGAGLLMTDVSGVGALFIDSNAPFIAGALYFLSFASLFAASAIATAVMRLSRERR